MIKKTFFLLQLFQNSNYLVNKQIHSGDFMPHKNYSILSAVTLPLVRGFTFKHLFLNSEFQLINYCNGYINSL